MAQDYNANIGEKTKRSLAWNTVLPGLFQIFRFGVSILIARLLNPKDFGIMGIASIIIFYADSLSNFGFSTALIQKKQITNDHINSVFSLSAILNESPM